MTKRGRPPNTIEKTLERRISTPQPDGASRNPPPGNCLIWPLARDKDGYGRVTIERETWRVHRLVWHRARGDVPEGLEVQHLCNIPACSNIDHLVLGTPMANRDYSRTCGRTATGAKNGKNTHPESRSYGDDNGSRKHPENLRRGDDHWSRRIPEKLATGERHGLVIHPEKRSYGKKNGQNTCPEKRPKGESHGRALLTAEQVLDIRASPDSCRTLAELYGVSSATIQAIRSRRIWAHI